MPSVLFRFLLRCACLAALGTSASARPGDLDLSFNPAGIGSTPGTMLMGLSDSRTITLKSVVELPDRKLMLLISGDSASKLIRVLPDGLPDLSFGLSGVHTLPPVQISIPDSMTVQSDGRILIGSHGLGMRVSRLLPDGSPDLSFGTSGVASLDDSGSSTAVRVALSGNGKILAAGSTLADGAGFPAMPDVPRIWRFLTNGSPDLTFGVAGKVSFNFARGDLRAIAVQPDGKVLITGSGQQSGFPAQLYLARCDTAGVLDPSFGFGGVQIQNGTTPYRLAVQPDGNIVVATGISPSMALQRFTPSGLLDTTFNGTGASNLTPGAPSGLALQADGKLLMAGHSARQIIILRYHADGTPDDGFGYAGVMRFSALPDSASASDIILLADGRILSAGLLQDPFQVSPRPDQILLVRGHTRDLSLAAESPAGNILHPYGDTVSVSALQGNPVAPEFVITLRNTGDRPLTNLSAVLHGSGAVSFEMLTPLPATLAAGGTAALTVRYFPSQEASVSSAVLVVGSAGTGESFFVVHLRGATELPVATLSLTQSGAYLSHDSTLLFGATLPIAPVTRILTIQNTGNIPLQVLGVSLGTSGNPGDFTHGIPDMEPLAPGASTDFPVTFTPSGPGPRTARLRIASTDTLNPPLEITLSGSLLTGLNAWRLTHFGTVLSEGDAADDSDPDHDGISNLVEFATFSDPLSSIPALGELVLKTNTFEYTFMRPSSAAGSVSYDLMHSSAPDGSYSILPWNETVLSDDGTRQKVRVTGEMISPSRGFIRLRVLNAD